jgi:hypothetical protein
MFDPLRQVVLLVTTVALQFQMPRGTRLLSSSAEIQRKAHKSTCVTEAPDAVGSGGSGLDPLVRASLLQLSQRGCKVRQPRTCMRTPKTKKLVTRLAAAATTTTTTTTTTTLSVDHDQPSNIKSQNFSLHLFAL